MPKVLRSLSELRKLQCILEEFGHASFKLTPLGVIRSTLHGYWSYEAVVDDWPDFTSLVLRPNIDMKSKYNIKYRGIYFYGEDPIRMKQLIEELGVIPWQRNFTIKACALSLRHVIKEEASKYGGDVTYTPEVYEAFIARDPEAIKTMKLSSDEFTLGSLQPEHSEQVYDNWSSRHSRSKAENLPYIRDLIQNNPSACAFDKQGKPVSWALRHYDGQTGFGFTVPEHRGKRVIALVTHYFNQKAMEAGYNHLFAYAAVTNNTVQKAVGQLWMKQDGLIWSGQYRINTTAKL